MSRLVFFDSRAQVLMGRASFDIGRSDRLIAVTADALQALEEVALPHQAVSEFADARELALVEERVSRDIFRLATELETFIGQEYPTATFDGPGFVSSQAYWLQYSLLTIALRVFLMRRAIRACSPQVVMAFDDEIDEWFRGDGYDTNPWLTVLAQVAVSDRFRLELLPRPPTLGAKSTLLPRALGSLRRRVSQILRRSTVTDGVRFAEWPRPNGSLRLLMADLPSYDWRAALSSLGRDVEVFALATGNFDHRVWTQFYAPTAERWPGRNASPGRGQAPMLDDSETSVVRDLVDVWLRGRPVSADLTVLGTDLSTGFIPHLKAVASLGPELARRADRVALSVLEKVRPHAVCFSTAAGLAATRLSFQAQRGGIPVVCYQHGGAYGTHQLGKNDLLEPSCADYFLTYGAGITPRPTPVIPVRARHVPVGSARIERMMVRAARSRRRRPGARFVVLWVGEISTRNMYGGAFQVEDTERYLIQKQCLGILDTGRLRVIFRPYVERLSWDGSVQWLALSGLRATTVNSWSLLEDLIIASDLVISDTTSGTTWNEVLALNRPLILYCDPHQTHLRPQFANDLDRACRWCKSVEEIVNIVRRLAAEPLKVMDEMHACDPQPFLRKYVLHEGDGCNVLRVVTFMDEVCRAGRSVEQWEATWNRPRATLSRFFDAPSGEILGTVHEPAHEWLKTARKGTRS